MEESQTVILTATGQCQASSVDPVQGLKVWGGLRGDGTSPASLRKPIKRRRVCPRFCVT
jgi:hypothetical protein